MIWTVSPVWFHPNQAAFRPDIAEFIELLKPRGILRDQYPRLLAAGVNVHVWGMTVGFVQRADAHEPAWGEAAASILTPHIGAAFRAKKAV